MSDLTAPGALLAQVLNQLDPDAHGSALTMSHNDLLARIVNAVSDGPDVSSLRLSETALLAALLNAVGGSGSNLTSSRGQLLAAINNALSDGVDLSPLTTTGAALFDAAFRLVGGEGGGGAYPEWLPQAVSGDRPLVYADFANEHYWAGGAEVTFAAVFEEFLDWGPFEGLTAGQGLGGSNNTVTIINPLGMDLIASGYTLLAVFEASGAVSGAIMFTLIQEPEWNPEYDFNVRPSSGGGEALSNLSLSSGTVQNPAQGPWVDGVHKSACTFDDGAFAASDDGSAVYTHEANPADAPVARVLLGPNGLSGDAYLTSVAFYPKQSQADLPVLTYIEPGGGGGGGTATGLPLSLDFLNGVYTANGGDPSSLATLFGQENISWGSWDVSAVQAGVGLVGGGASSPIFLAPTLSELLTGVTYVARVVVAEDAIITSGALQIDHFDGPGYAFQRIIGFGVAGSGSYLGDGASELETFAGFDVGSTHLVAFTITPTHMAVSVDGGALVSADLSAPGVAANEVGLGVAPGVTCTLLTARAAVDDIYLWTFSAANIGGFPYSSPTPPTPATLWSADFANGVYEANGSPSTMEAMFAEDLMYAGWNPATDIHAGLGATFCGPTATPFLFALMTGGATFVITGTRVGASAGSFVGAVNFTNGFDVWTSECNVVISAAQTEGHLQSDSADDFIDGPGVAADAAFKLAVTLRGNHVAFCFDGGDVFVVPAVAGGWPDMTAWGIDCTRFYLAQIEALSWRDDADLPALSALPARASFGWVSAGGAGANCCFSGEHDASVFTNDTGSTVLVDQIVLQGLTGGAGASVECALYADSAGAPGALLGETNTVVVAAGDNVFTLASPVSVADGVSVWAAVRCSSTLAASGGSGATTQHYKSAAWPAAFTNPYGASVGYPLSVPAQMRGNVG